MSATCHDIGRLHISEKYLGPHHAIGTKRSANHGDRASRQKWRQRV